MFCPTRPRDTPGFKIPRQIQVEILSIDGEALARSIQDEAHRGRAPRLLREPQGRVHSARPGFPTRSSPDDPKAELTPPQLRPFEEVRPYLATSLAEEKAQAEIVNRFAKIKDEVMIPFADNYHDALDEINEAKKTGEKTDASACPGSNDLKALAAAEGLTLRGHPCS